MRVLFLANHFNTGGISSYLLTLSRGLMAQGHEVFALTSGGNLVEKFESAGGKHFDFGFRVKSDGDPRIYFSLPHAKTFARLKIDIIHSNTRATQVMGCSYSRRLGVPYVSTCHGFFKPKLFRRLFPCWGKRVIAISGPVKEHLVRDFHVDPFKVELIPNGIDLAEFSIPTQEAKEAKRRQHNISGGPVVGIIARLSDVKGHVHLIRAFKDVLRKFPLAKLLIVGEGPEEEKLRRSVSELQLSSSVVFFKIIDRTAEVLPLFDIFVMPSLQEGLGLSVMEAQAMGLPVVASRVGGLPDLIENNHTGVLVEPQDPQALAQAIISVLENPVKSWNMGRSARIFIEHHYSAPQMTQRTSELYEGLIKK